MNDLYLLLTPILMLGVVSLVGFVGCGSVWGLDKVEPPASAPTNLQAMAGDGMVVLSWDPYDDPTGEPTEFRVKKSGGAAGSYDPNVAVPAPATSHEDRFVENGETYTYALTAVVDGKQSSRSNEVQATPMAGALVSFVTSFILGTSRPGYEGFIGMAFELGPDPVTLRTLGRIRGIGQTGSKVVKVVDGVTNADVPGATVLITFTQGDPEEFIYAPLATPVTLSRTAANPAGLYYLVSQETTASQFWDSDTMILTTTVADRVFGIYAGPTGQYAVGSPDGYSYGPLDFQY